MCYHHLGDRRSLKQQYSSLQRILREELDVDPLPETSSLYETLMVSM
jgi:DNA-binding SARP family transcriptional activator